LPHRHYFYDKIAQGSSEEHLNTEMDRWVEGANLIVKRISQFLADGGYGKV